MLKNQANTSDALTSSFVSFSLTDPILDDLIGSDVLSQGKAVNSFEASQHLRFDGLDLNSLNDNSVTQSNLKLSEAIDGNVSNNLEVTDASTSDTLFNLSASDLGTAGTTPSYTLRTSYDDPIDYGDPLTDAAYWRQQAGGASCAVVAQISVYESLTGYRISEADACNYAQSQGWFDPQTGTQPTNIVSILNALGIATYGGSNSTINQLAYALSVGDKPVVGLDASEIWEPQYDRYGNPLEQADKGHAVWVTGIDVKPNGSVNVVLNDSGTSFGQAEVVSYSDFYNAWQDYDFCMSVADNPLT
jgi:hypothetical protein